MRKSTKKKTKTKRKRATKRKTTKRKRAKSTALVKAAPAPVRKLEPWVLRRDQVELLKRTVAKGTTDDEFQLFLWVAKKHKLDPMTRQLHCVKRWSSAEGRELMAIQIGIDGYRTMAARSHNDYGSIDEPEFEYDDKGALLLARVRIWKKGHEHPTVAVAFWSEYAPDLAKPQSFMWRKMPKGQLAKCAESLALRKAYPDLADIYTDEEMAQADDDLSPEGREVTTLEGHPPSEATVIQKPEYQRQFPDPPPLNGRRGQKGSKQVGMKFDGPNIFIVGDTFDIKDTLKENYNAQQELDAQKKLKSWRIPANESHEVYAFLIDAGYTVTELDSDGKEVSSGSDESRLY